ncbi:MAG: hypothetical protein ACYDG2_10240 [Ruminiclostridium sp.]
MKKKIPKIYTLKEIEKLFKPKLISNICYALILSGPYLNLFRIIIDKSYHELLLCVIFTGVTLPLFTLNWVWYIYELKHYKIDAKKYYDLIEKSRNQ